MTDTLTRAARSGLMAKIKGRDTGPERRVRSIAHRAGFRFSLRRRDLPGSPDLVFPARRAVVFVHGCFWHRHGCRNSTTPKSAVEFWEGKFAANVARDARVERRLRRMGWRVMTVWECALSDEAAVTARLRRFLAG